MPMAAFPCNIVQDILARLDVRALLRFKSASKSWLRLICSHYFHDLHCSKSQHKLSLLYRSNLAFSNYLGFAYLFSTVKLNDHTPVPCSRFIAKVDGPIKLILPSCLGLFCFATENRIHVCNPATRRINMFPCAESDETRMCGFGFTYISSIKCYTVVKLLYHNLSRRIECSVLHLERGANVTERSWRVVEQVCPYFVEEMSLPASVEGTIYWKIGRRQLRRRNNDDILAFDISKSEFQVIGYPSDMEHRAPSWIQLVELDGVLSVVRFSPCDVVLWMHREGHWHRGGVIDISGFDGRVFGEINCIKDGQIIFISLHCNVVLFYDTKSRAFNKVQIPVSVRDLGIYCESLFPL